MKELTLITETEEYAPVSSEHITEEWKLRESIRDTVYGLRHGVSEEEIRKHLTRNPQAKYWYEPEEVEYILKRAREEIGSNLSSEPDEFQGSEFHELMLHAVAEMYGPGGIVVDEERAKATSCECVEYKPDKFWCTSKGVVGALTDEQEKIYCNPRIMVERPALKERLTRFGEAVEYCRAQLPPTDGRTRLEVYLDCMSRELKKVGIEA